MQATPHLWWQKGIVYQIYPRSFMDSNGDGIGDLKGISSRLDYLRDLGIAAIWLSPIYPSPMADFGYDIADYTEVDPIFGDLAAFDQLVEQAHARDLKLLVDLVPNHSSDEHAWFKEARSSRDNPKRDWYIWRDPKPDGSPPNNWQAAFGGSTWEFDPATSQYYLHTFHVKQPDLNWRNPQVREAMYAVMRFWLDRGVDGFRIDVLPVLIKDEAFRDNPVNPHWQPGDFYWNKLQKIYSENRPEVHKIVQEMRKLTEEYPERVLIGETYLPYSELMRYYGEKLDEAHLPFNFELILLRDWHAAAVKRIVDSYEASLPTGAWPNWVLGNHDNSRLATRIGAEQARIGQMLLLTLRGTPTCYYGDELGMRDITVPPELQFDPQGKADPALSRDPARSPMQWDSGPVAGFSTAQPWLPLTDDYKEVNVATESHDARSILALFRQLTELRRTLPALAVGEYATVETNNAQIFGYLREHAGQKVLVLLNFGAATEAVKLTTLAGKGEILCSTFMDAAGTIDLAQAHSRPNEGLVIQV